MCVACDSITSYPLFAYGCSVSRLVNNNNIQQFGDWYCQSYDENIMIKHVRNGLEFMIASSSCNQNLIP